MSLMKTLALVAAACTTQSKVLCGMETNLPEPWKSEIGKLRGEFDAVLAKMPPTEQVATATGVNEGLRELSWAVERLVSINEAMTGMVSKLRGESDTVLASMPDRVAAAVTEKITAGELVTSEQAAKNVSDAVAAVDARHALANTRRATLVTAGLPMPSESLLAADEAAFESARTEAVNRTEALKKKGVVLNGAPLTDLVWASKPDFEQRIGLIDAVLATGKRGPDPTLGGQEQQAVQVCV